MSGLGAELFAVVVTASDAGVAGALALAAGFVSDDEAEEGVGSCLPQALRNIANVISRNKVTFLGSFIAVFNCKSQGWGTTETQRQGADRVKTKAITMGTAVPTL